MSNDIKNQLATLEIFRNVSYESVENILEQCEYIKIEKNDTLIIAGEMTSTIYLLIYGELKATLKHSENEDSFTIKVGQTIGELSILEGGRAAVTVKATKSSTLIAIDEVKFWRLIDSSHEFSKNILKGLASRIKKPDDIVPTESRPSSSLVDSLTGLRNRKWLNLNLPKIMNRLNHDNKSLSLIMLEIINIKECNEIYENLTTDEVLSMIAETISYSLRPTDFDCRYGGNKFLIILPKSNRKSTIKIEGRLKASIKMALSKFHHQTKESQLDIITKIETSNKADTAVTLLNKFEN